MRVLVRRERPHPGAQLDVFEERDDYRYQAVATNTTVGQVAFLEARHRAHARHFGATMPADGGRPALSPTMQRRRDRETGQRPERRGGICPTCFVELPVSGTCMTCA